MLSQDLSDSPLVSVIIPAWNAERFLAQTLDSVRAQTYGQLEIIVVNDGSTDSTVAIVEEAALEDRRIRLVHEKNLGVAAARNRGLLEARANFIAPIDADDVWDPRNVELQMRALRESGPNVGVCYAWFLTIDEHGSFCGTGPRSQLRRRTDVFRAQLNVGNFIGNSSSTVMRRAAIEAVGGYDPTLRARGAQGCEDQALYALLAENWDFTFVPKYLIAYRKHPWAMSSDGDRMARSQTFVLTDLRDRWPAMPVSWYGRGIARVYEGPLMAAIGSRNWRQAKDILVNCAKLSCWSFFRLLAVRLPARAFGFLMRRLAIRTPPEPPPTTQPNFWAPPNVGAPPHRADATQSLAKGRGLI